jgi:GTP pyrophosphokinase
VSTRASWCRSSAPRARAQVEEAPSAQQTENVRKMLLAFSRDLRVVLLRLASRLQTLRWFTPPAASRCPAVLARESLQVFAPLANRLGIWQIKWEWKTWPSAS